MKFENLQLGMFVSVTDEYRAIIPAAITWGKGEGRVVRFSTMAGDWKNQPKINIPEIVWADRHRSTMHPKNLQPSTKKKYFMATLS